MSAGLAIIAPKPLFFANTTQNQFAQNKLQFNQDSVFKVPLPRKVQMPSQEEKKIEPVSLLRQIQYQQSPLLKEVDRRIVQQKFQDIIQRQNLKMFLLRMQYFAKQAEFKDSSFLIPIGDLQFGPYLLNSNQMDFYIWKRKLIVPKNDTDAQDMQNEQAPEESKETACYENEKSEFVAQNGSQIRIEKVVEFKIPKEYLDAFGQENEDSTNESEDLNVPSPDNAPLNQEPAQGQKVGRYSLSERSVKIMKYKMKLQKRRQRIPLTREFTGRKQIALSKNRVKGKFQKSIINEDKQE